VRRFFSGCGRPGPVDIIRPDGIDGKAMFRAAFGSPQRANAAMRPMAPGSAATHCATATIHSMPKSISRQNTPSKPNGMAASPNRPAGITSAEITGIANRFAITPYGVTR
jgi:hypothetical protein